MYDIISHSQQWTKPFLSRTGVQKSPGLARERVERKCGSATPGRTTPFRNQTMRPRTRPASLRQSVQVADANQASEQLFDIAGKRIRLRHRAEPRNHGSLLVDQELRKVPLDAFSSQHARRFLGQITK